MSVRFSTTILEALGCDVSSGREQRITTGSGVAVVKEIIVDKFRIGSSCVITDVKVYAHDFPDESFSTGVVGLNVLSQFDIHLQFSRKLIQMTRI